MSFAESAHDEQDEESIHERDTDVESQKASPESKPEAAKHVLPVLSLFFLLLSVILLLLVAFSTPLIKSMHMFTLSLSVNAKVDAVSTGTKFGVWGYCSTGVTNTFAFPLYFSRSV